LAAKCIFVQARDAPGGLSHKKLRQDNIQNLRQVKETSDRIRELREKTEKVTQAIEEESQKNGRK
jgi:hypothetical protein